MAPYGISEGVSVQFLEEWLNEKLQKADELGYVGVFRVPEHAKPLNRYGLDRLTLQGHGIRNDDIQTLYRAINVHSFGIFETINKIIGQVGFNFTTKKQFNKDIAPSTNSNIPATDGSETASGHLGKR